MARKRTNLVEMAMHYRQIVILVVCCLVAFGIYSLPNMKKNEFPDFVVREGIVAAVAPGMTSEEVEEQVAKQLEDYIFTYKEVRKDKTYSMSRDGMVYVRVVLNDDLENKDEFWSKFKHGISQFKSKLPKSVVAVVVNDDFGDTSALLVSIESGEKTYAELKGYAESLCDRLRTISSVGRLSISGMRNEQITVRLDYDRLSQYGLSDRNVAATLLGNGLTLSGGRAKDSEHDMPVYVSSGLNTAYEVGRQIVYTTPEGKTVRLGDIAEIRREYPDAESEISNNGRKCLLLSVEMKKGENVVKMGADVNREIEEFRSELPSEVGIYRITDQSQVVGDSVVDFLRELATAVATVILVVILLLPMKVALVAAFTIPVTIFTSLGLFYAFGIELNTVTLAALMVTLGLIVDDSIIIIDNYLEQIGEGVSRWHATINSATHFFKSILTATLAISITFFPFLITCTGIIHDFLLSFPWAITIVLGVSLIVASLFVPFLQYFFIRKPLKTDEQSQMRPDGRKPFSFLAVIQKSYDKILAKCLSHPYVTVSVGAVCVVLGAILFASLPQKSLPTADRDQFAVEIYTPYGTSLAATGAIADSVEHTLRRDARVKSVTSFKGCSSPRFHSSYAPQMPGLNYAQFIVNTTGIDATVAVLDDYADEWGDRFPGAIVKFKQLDYTTPECPIEIRLSSTDESLLMREADKVEGIMREEPSLKLVRTNYYGTMPSAGIRMKEEEASRLGLTKASIETTLAMRYGSGISVASIWEGDTEVPIVIKGLHADSVATPRLGDEQIPVIGGLRSVPLRQVADVTPAFHHGQIVRRNGVPTITVMADLKRGINAEEATRSVKSRIDAAGLSPEVKVAVGGEHEDSKEKMDPVMAGLVVSAAIIFFILVSHFGKLSLSVILFLCVSLCVPGAALGLKLLGVPYSVTCVLGMVSLMGIIVRNGIIMYDYAEELRHGEHMVVPDAIYHSASRRMRPITLTSAAASVGVIPMIMGGSSLWMPMGTVVCVGTMVSMIFILTVLPCAYLVSFRKNDKELKIRRAQSEAAK
ncbi:MAG: efflux RND transporter permease subunit [Marinilabiliaceae bacterium]